MNDDAGLTLTMDSAKAVAGAIRFGRRFSREGMNNTPTPSAGAGVSHTASWPIEVTGSPPGPSGDLLELYEGTLYLPDATASPPWRAVDCWVRAVTGHSLTTGDVGLGRLVGWRTGGGGFDAMPIYCLVVNAVTGSVFSGSHVTHSATQNVTTGVMTIVDFDTEEYDTDAYHHASVDTERLTIPADGCYHVGAFITFPNSVGGVRYLQMRLNGTEIGGQSAPAGGGPAGWVDHRGFSTDKLCTAGDYFEIAAGQDSGGTLTLPNDALHRPKFWIHRIR